MQRSILPKGLSCVALHLILVTGFSTVINAGEVKLNGRTFTIPDGFTIERIAGPPLVDRPITAAFDDEGRLYVADSSGSNDNVKKQLAEKPHRIVRLEDTDGDGKFDKRTVFADKMMFPEGTMWLDGSLYVAAPPSHLEADRHRRRRRGRPARRVVPGQDAHRLRQRPARPVSRPRTAGSTGARGHSPSRPTSGPASRRSSTRAAHIFRCRPDGTGIEPVMTGGMDNPVDVVFTPGGERIFTTTFFVHPGGGQRDGLIHAIYGGIYGKVHDPIFEPAHKWTGPEVMPVLLHMGPAAPCGLTRYESDAFGKEYQDNLFACYFNLHKVGRHVLTPAGGHLHDPGRRLRLQPRPRLPPDRRPRGRRRQPGHRRHRRLVQALLPDLAAPQARRAGGDLSRQAQGRAQSRRSVGTSSGSGPDRPSTACRQRAWSNCSATRGRPCSGARSRPSPRPGDAEPMLRSCSREVASKDRIAVAAAQRRLDRSPGSTIPRPGRWSATFLDDPDETVRQAAIHAAGLWRDREATSRADRAAPGSLGAEPPRRGRGAGADRRQVGRARAPGGRRASRRSHPRTLDHLCLDRDRRSAGDRGRLAEHRTRA